MVTAAKTVFELHSPSLLVSMRSSRTSLLVGSSVTTRNLLDCLCSVLPTDIEVVEPLPRGPGPENGRLLLSICIVLLVLPGHMAYSRHPL